MRLSSVGQSSPTQGVGHWFESNSRDKMAKKKEVTLQQRKEYLEFLEKRLKSENYKKSVTKEEYEKTKQKYDKEKLLIKMLS